MQVVVIKQRRLKAVRPRKRGIMIESEIIQLVSAKRDALKKKYMNAKTPR